MIICPKEKIFLQSLIIIHIWTNTHNAEVKSGGNDLFSIVLCSTKFPSASGANKLIIFIIHTSLSLTITQMSCILLQIYNYRYNRITNESCKLPMHFKTSINLHTAYWRLGYVEKRFRLKVVLMEPISLKKGDCK